MAAYLPMAQERSIWKGFHELLPGEVLGHERWLLSRWWATGSAMPATTLPQVITLNRLRGAFQLRRGPDQGRAWGLEWLCDWPFPYGMWQVAQSALLVIETRKKGGLVLSCASWQEEHSTFSEPTGPKSFTLFVRPSTADLATSRLLVLG